MKKDIVVCCEDMLAELVDGHVIYDGKLIITPVGNIAAKESE